MGFLLRCVLPQFLWCLFPLVSVLDCLNSGVSWYIGCFSVDILEQCELGYWSSGHVVELSSCSKFCLQKGFWVTILRNETDCFCANMSTFSFSNDSLHNTISPNASNIEHRISNSWSSISVYKSKACRERCAGPVCLPYGDGASSLALYSSAGPYIHNASISLVANMVQTGKDFLLEVSGYLASSVERTLGIQSLASENFTTVNLLVNWTRGKRKNYTANVESSGYFTVSLKWMYTEPGSHAILVRLTNLISEEELHKSIEVLTPVPGSLEVKIEQTEEQMPSCLPFEMDALVFMERVFVGINYKLIAFVSMGIQLDFRWHFSDDNSTHHTASLLPDGLTSSMSHTFTKEGLFQVGVNVSNTYNWTQETLCVAVVEKALFNLTFSIADGYIAAVEQNLSLEIKLYTTVRQLLLLNISSEPGEMHTRRLSDDSPAFGTLDHLHPSESYGLHRCQMHFHTFHHFRTVGNYTLTVSVSYESQVLFASLPQQVQVYEPITAIFPVVIWKKIVQTGVDVVFAVTSSGSHVGSKCQWNITKTDATLLSLVNSEWSLKSCFGTPGFYFLSVVCFNALSSSRYSAQIEAQEVILNLSIPSSNPRYIQYGYAITLNATIGQGSSISVVWTFTPDEAPIVGTLLTANYMYTKPGLFLVTVAVQNNVSSDLASLEVIVQDPVGEMLINLYDMITVNHPTSISIITTSGTNISLELFFNRTLALHTSNCLPNSSVELSHTFNQTGHVEVLVRGTNQVSTYTVRANTSVVEELYFVAIEVVNQPALGEDVILTAKVNGYLWQNKNYIYQWTLVNNWTHTSGSPVFTYRCRELGLHTVGLTVSNMASIASTKSLINVTQGKVGQRLDHVSNAVLGEPVLFTLKIFSNAITNVLVSFGDETDVFASDSSSFSVNHSYTASGIYSIRMTLNRESISSIIVIQEPLKDLNLEGPYAVSLSTSLLVPTIVTWNARIGNGSNYIYRWMYSNGTVNSTALGPPKLMLQFTMPSIITILLRAENECGHLWASMTTTVQYPILSLSLSASPTALHQVTHLEIVIEPKQDYMITVSFGDGSNLSASSQQMAPVTGCLHYRLGCSIFTLEHSYPAAACYNVSVIVSNSVSMLAQATEAVVEEPVTGIQVTMITPLVIRLGDHINATVSVQSGTDVSFLWNISCSDRSYTVGGSTLSIKTVEPGMYHISVSVSSPLHGSPGIHHAPYVVAVRAPITAVKAHLPFGINFACLRCQADGACATKILAFSAQATDEADFSFDFGDGSPVVNVSGHVHLNGIGASAYHQYNQEGVYMIKVTAYNEFYSTTHQVGPYYIEMAPEGLFISVNPSMVHKDEVIHLTASLAKGTNVTYTWNMGDQTTYVNEGPVITHVFSTVTSHNVTVTARNRVGSSTSWIIVPVMCRMQSVSVLTNGTVFATDTDIAFRAVTADPCPSEYVWHFGDGLTERTTSRSITKRYSLPNRYNVIVNASNSISSFTSDIYPITVQRRVVPNRLVARPSVLVNSNVTFECRINSGTNASYQWSFGDGTVRTGRNIGSHIYSREGEFTIEVLIFNNVSSAILKKQIFIVREHCQPPPVKHMGPVRLQVRRYQSLELGVTFEAAISCNISQGLSYRWSLITSSGTQLPLPPSVDIKKQTLALPRYLLEYGNFTAVARVQVIGSVVYSNYTVPIEVPPSLPVSVIAGGNHLFISKTSASIILLNGSESYDLDYPGAKMRFFWRCNPASRQKQSCFNSTLPQPFHSSSEAIAFHAELLDDTFDQFLVTLTVSSADRTSLETQVFLSVHSNPTFRLIQLFCDECEGNSVNWNKAFSVQALCADCMGTYLSYSWNLHLINATESTRIEVPFCRAMDLMSSSSLFGVVLPSPGKATDVPTLIASAATPVPQPTAKRFMPTVATLANITYYNTSVQPARSTGVNSKNSLPSDSPVNSTLNTSSALKTESTATSRSIVTVSQRPAATTTSTTTTVGIAELPYPGPGFLEEGSSGARPPRIRRSATGSSTTIASVDRRIAATKTPTAKNSPSSSFGSSRDALLPSDFSEGQVGSSRPGHQPFYEGASRFSETIVRPSAGQRTRNMTSGTIIGRGEGGRDSSNTTDLILQDFETHYTGVQEGGGASGGRPSGEGSMGVSPNRGSTSESSSGDDLVDSSISGIQPAAMLMLDWRRNVIHRNIFQSYTATGISSQAVAFRPFVLKPSKMYMLEVSVASNEIPLGKAQLYFTVHEKPIGMTCQVQPKDGFEIYSVFSIFCTSGKEDLHYEFSYRVGNSSRKPLYKGRDIQYYFSLPAGDPSDGYKVTVLIEITNRFGSNTRPCPVNVTVLPSFLRNLSSSHKPEDELYFSSLKNLSTLLLMGNHIEIRNYITLLTIVLNRLYTEESRPLYDLQSQTRKALISSVCSLSVQDKEEMTDVVIMLSDLMNVTRQMTLESAILVMNHIREMAKLFLMSHKFVLDKNLILKLIQVISNAMEVSDSHSESVNSLMFEGIKSTSELLLKFMSLSNEPQFYVRTTTMDLQTSRHHSFQNTIQIVSSTRFYLLDVVDKQITARTGFGSKCYISQIINFRKNPYAVGKTPLQIVGDVVDLSLYNCSSRRKINIRGLISPIAINFEVKSSDAKKPNHTSFSLFRNKVNFHHFLAMPENQQEALQITLKFSKPHTRAFPVLMLVRFSQKPTPTNFNMKRIHFWDAETAQMFIPASSLKGSCYLALLDADYNRKTKNKYLASVVNYTVSVQWTQCLYWDDVGEWKSDGCYPQQGATATTVICRCNHLTTFTIAKRPIRANFENADVSQFLSVTSNLVPCTVVVLSLSLYVLLAMACKILDHHQEKKNGYVFLQDNTPSDQQVYAIIVDTGFRSRPKTTAKVHIVLHGEDGVSETRELYCPDKPLFERNSRHTFIMSLPESLGPIWKIHLWHNNSGHSPSWYISHLIVKDLMTCTSWFFPAECWLAVDEGDGKVERELTSISNGLGFRKLLYCRFTEYLEDFHFWGSVYSRPSNSWFTHTQRLTICLVLFLGYMCLNTWLIHCRQEEYTAEFGLIGVSTASMVTGMVTALAFLPMVALLSLLFRLSKKQWRKDPSEDQCKDTRGSQMCSPEGHRGSLLEEDATFDSYLPWQHFQQWAQEAWRKKYERDSFTPSIHSRHHSERSRRGSLSSTDRTSSGFEDCSSRDNKPSLNYYKHGSNDVHSDYSECSSLAEQQEFHVHKVLPHWCCYLAWVFCVLIALVCVAITGIIGLRFGPTKCILWLHSLFFSTVICIFVLQPFVILVVAAVVAWKDRERSDFFIETLCEATKYLECEPGHFPKHFVLHCRPHPHDASTEFEKILAARQRARYLRLARPPTPAQLKEAKDRIRKNTLIQQTLREFVMYVSMLFLLIFITFSKFSNDEYLLNHAVRTEFTRNTKNPFTEIKTADKWWDWSFTTLLDGLYWDTWYNRAAAKTQAGPVGGKCFLIGSPILRQLKVIDSAACVVPLHFVTLIHDCRPPYSLSVRAPEESVNVSNAEEAYYHRCGQTQCYEGRGSVVNFGRSRTEAYSTLLNLRKTRWINRSTRAVIVEFSLYNPPTNLFTSVSLLAEMPPSGGIITSSFIESVSIYQISSFLDYFIMVCELVFIGLVLIHFYFQLTTMIQRGLLNYWQEPWNWMELSMIGLILCYYAYIVYRFVLAVDIIDRLQSGFFQVFIDLSYISSWDQWARCLHGIILFLLLMKCIRLLRIHKMMAPCVSMLRLSCSSVMLTLLAGIVFMAAYSSLGYVLFMSKSYPFSSIARSCKTVLLYFLGVSEIKTLSSFYKSNQVSVACYYGTFFIIMTVLWTGMLRGVLTSFAKEAKKSVRSKHIVALGEVTAHTWEKVLSFVGRQRQKSSESVSLHGSNFYLDEFENLIDELLFRLNAFSNSLHHSLPAKPYQDTEEEEEEEEENPQASSSDYYCSQGSENPVLQENCMRQNVKVEEELLNNSEISDVLSARKPSTDSGFGTQNPQRPCLEFEVEEQHQLQCETLPLGASFNATEERISDQSRCVDSSSNQKSTLYQSSEQLLPGELFFEAPAAKTSQIGTSDSSSLSQQENSPGQENVMGQADTIPPAVTCGAQCVENHSAQSQRTESRLSSQPRCASASASGKSRKTLKRSPTTVIEPLDRRNAALCTADDPGADPQGSQGDDNGSKCQHFPSPNLLSGFTQLNRANENQSQGKRDREEDCEQPTLRRKPNAAKKLQNVLRVTKKVNVTAPDAAEKHTNECIGHDLRVSVRQCW